MKKYFISYVLQKDDGSNIFKNSLQSVDNDITYDDIKNFEVRELINNTNTCENQIINVSVINFKLVD